MDTATLSCEWTNQRAGSQLNMHTYDDTRRSIFCVNRDCLIFEVHQIISWLLRDFFIFSSKKRTFLAKYRLFGEKEDLICVFFKKVLFADQSPLKRTQLVSLHQQIQYDWCWFEQKIVEAYLGKLSVKNLRAVNRHNLC